MAAHKRTQEQRDIDLGEVAKLLRRGLSKTQIAACLNVTRQQVAYDWKQLLKQLLAERETDVEAARTAKLEEYREVKGEAWSAWERSKDDKERRVAETISTEPQAKADGKGKTKAGSNRTKAVKQVEGRLPDHDYLSVILKCLDAERELDGLNPAKSHEITGAGGGPLMPIILQIVEEVVTSGPAAESPAAPGPEGVPAK